MTIIVKQQQQLSMSSNIFRTMLLLRIVQLPPVVVATSTIIISSSRTQQQQRRQRRQKQNSLLLLLLTTTAIFLSIQQLQQSNCCYSFHIQSTKTIPRSSSSSSRNKISWNNNNYNNHHYYIPINFYHHYSSPHQSSHLLLSLSSSQQQQQHQQNQQRQQQEHEPKQQQQNQRYNKYYYPNTNNIHQNTNFDNHKTHDNNNNDDDDSDHQFITAIQQEYNLPKLLARSRKYTTTSSSKSKSTSTSTWNMEEQIITTATYNSILQLLQHQLKSNFLPHNDYDPTSDDNYYNSESNTNTNNQPKQQLQSRRPQRESISSSKYGRTAEQILRRMIGKQQHQHHPHEAQVQQQQQKPNRKTIHLVLDIYRIICSSSSSSLSLLLDSTGSTIGTSSNTSTMTTTTSLVPNIKGTDTIRAIAQVANTILHEWNTIWYPNRYVVEASDVTSYNIVMSCYNEIGNYQQVQTIFEQTFVQQQYRNDWRMMMQIPTTSTDDNDKQQQQQQGTPLLHPNIISFNCLVKAYSMSGQMHRAQELLQNMIQQQQQQPPSGSAKTKQKTATTGKEVVVIPFTSARTSFFPKPTIHSYNIILYAYAKSKYYHPLLAHKFLLEWLTQTTTTTTTMAPKDNDDSKTATTASSHYQNMDIVYPNTYSYNIVLHAMTQAIRLENNQRRQRSNSNEKKDVPVRKQTDKYNTRIPTTNTNKIDSSRNKINSRKGYTPTTDTRLTPSVSSYNRLGTVMNNNNKEGTKNYYNLYDDETTAALLSDPDCIIHRTQALFDSIPVKDVISYTSLIAAYCETVAAAKRSDTGTSNRRSSYDNSNNNKSSSKNTTDNNSTSRDAIQQTLDVVRNIVHRAYADESIQITASFLSNVIYSLTTLEDIQAAVLADQLVQGMIQQYNVQPTVSLYNALIYCWGKSVVSVPSSSSSSNSKYGAPPDNIQRIFDIVQTMESSSLSLGLQPNTITYTNVLEALKVSISYSTKVTQSTYIVEAAEKLLSQMENQYQQSKKQEQQQQQDRAAGRTLYTVRPSIATYTTMIQIYGRSRVPFKAIKAATIIRRMNSTENNIRPNIITYNAVLNACEYTDPASDASIIEAALKVACDVFDEVRTSTTIQANHVTYASFIGVVGTLIPSSSNTKLAIIKVIFRKCCLDGQVSKLVLKKVRTAVSSYKRYQEDILQGYKEDSLPTDWTRNAPSETIKARQYL